MKKILNRIFVTLTAFLLMFFVGFESTLSILVKAEEATETTVTYSNVLDDLKKDENFDEAAYPSKDSDNSLNVIQVAESENNELFVYVYQPSHTTKDLVATSINLSTKNDGQNVHNYSLSLVSNDGVFDKYVVKDFAVKKIVLRFYYIPSIFRAFDENIDDLPTDDNTISEVSCPVGQLWSLTTINDTVVCEMDVVDLITITSKHVGFIRYVDLKLLANYSYTDSHYVAFNTDKPIDKLIKASLTFTHQLYYKETNSSLFVRDHETVYESITEDKELLASEIFSKDSWFHDDYEYNRIQSTSEFIKNEDEKLTSETQTALSDTKWVLRFYESGYNYHGGFTTSSDALWFVQNYQEHYVYTVVSDVSILRLDYEYDGEFYSLGVVDNISSGDSDPDNEDWDKNDWAKNFFKDLEEMFNEFASVMKGIVGVFVAILAIGVLVFVLWLLVSILRFIGGTIKKIFKGKK